MLGVNTGCGCYIHIHERCPALLMLTNKLWKVLNCLGNTNAPGSVKCVMGAANILRMIFRVWGYPILIRSGVRLKNANT